MRVLVFLVIVIISGFGNFSAAQNTAQIESKYRSAVSDYRQGRYAVAMEKFSPLTSINSTSNYSQFAHYYYGLSAYQLKKYKESKQMLLQLLTRFPGWNMINDVYYLLGANYLATGQWKDGLGYFLRIKDSSFAKDVQSVKQHYLSEIKDLSVLKDIQKQFPTDRDVAVALISFIQASPSSSKTDMQFAGQLESQFKISNKEKATVAEDLSKKNVSKPGKSAQDTGLNVSVLLPFRLDEFVTSKKRTNQFAYDYYLGLVEAREKLKQEGIVVNLWAYDVSTDQKVMSSIVDNSLFQQSSLVIGPLYPGTFDVAAAYASDAKMFMLNPLSTDSGLLKTPNIYLAHPSISFQVQKAAEWMKIAGSPGPVAIYYGNTPKDSMMAAAYASEIKSKGGKVIELLKLVADREWMEAKISTFETTKPGHVALFSSNGSSGLALIEVLNGRKLSTVPMVATAASFNLLQSRLGRFGSRLYLIQTDYVDRDKEQIRQFQKMYWNKNSSFPTVYSFQGYDQLLFFGRMMSKYKDRLDKGLEMRRYDDEDYLLSGFDYTKSRENQISPLLKYNGAKWVPVGK